MHNDYPHHALRLGMEDDEFIDDLDDPLYLYDVLDSAPMLSSKKRVYYPGQILSPRKLKVGMKIVLAHTQDGHSIHRSEHVITRIEMEAGKFFLDKHSESQSDRMFAHHFTDKSLVPYGKHGWWNNHNWLEYPTP